MFYDVLNNEHISYKEDSIYFTGTLRLTSLLKLTWESPKGYIKDGFMNAFLTIASSIDLQPMLQWIPFVLFYV